MLTFEECEEIVRCSVFCLRNQDYQKQHPIWPGQVGLELESLVLDKKKFDRDEPVLVSLADLSKALTVYAENHNYSLNISSDKLMGVKLDDEDHLSFEPGGQLEYSSKPYPCLGDALRRMRSVQTHLTAFLKDNNFSLLQTGINPWHSVQDIGLQMSKPRYKAMDKYFASLSPFGQQMMRQTCTVQVNLDFGASESILAMRYLAANYIAPFATAIFAYSPIWCGKPTGMASYRSHIWRQMDASRTGIPAGLNKLRAKMDKATCVENYLQALMDAQVIFVEALDYKVPEPKCTFRDWLRQPIEGVSPTAQDFHTHMSLFFPEVRARGFLELRSVDCQARSWQSVVAGFYAALLYDEKNLDWVLATFEPYLENLSQWLLKAAHGLQEKQFATMARQLMDNALLGITRLPPCFQGEGLKKNIENFYEHFTLKGRTPADDLLDELKAQAHGRILPSNFIRLEDRWQLLVK